MKAFKTIKTALLAVISCNLLATLTASCSSDDAALTPEDDLIWDIAPLVISVKVVSPEGYAVLNANTTSRITAYYQGNTFACIPLNRAYAPQSYGLTYMNDYLLFGELSGTDTYHGEQLILNWGDGSKQDTITFSHQMSWQDNTPTFKREFRLNGKVQNDQIVIYKDLSAFNQPGADTTPRRTIPLSPQQLQLVYRINNFGFNLFRHMYASLDSPTHSCVASPLSVSYTLGMIAAGARFDFQEENGTRAEILQALDMRDSWQYDFMDPMTQCFKLLIQYTPLVDTSIDIQLANALFTRKDFTIYGGYPAFLAQYYQADFESLDFSAPDALEHINGWAYQKSKGLIPIIINQINPQTVALLLNAIYFHGGWSYPFDAQHTQEDDFTTASGQTTKLAFMHNKILLPYTQTDAFQCVRLPFNKQAYQMYILLPRNNHSVADILPLLNQQLLTDLKWTTSEVTLSLPRFETNSDYDSLPDILQKMGIRRMFTPKAEFTEISPDSIFVSMMRQKARLKVDEKGCEAAAVTIVDYGSTAELETPTWPQATFNADHPFIYLITEQSSGAVFFIGTFGGN